LYHSNAECIYITHQLNIQAGWLSSIANKVHHHYIKYFNQVWIPDFEEQAKSLAGLLSRNHTLKNVTYIGPLSRLEPSTAILEDLDYLFLLSGPEPQRTILETALFETASKSNKSICMVRGSNVPQAVRSNTSVSVINYATSDQLSNLMQRAKTIVCRSGYSTLMDLSALHKKKIVLIPTPGQREQEYLADYWKETYQAKVILQKDLLNEGLVIEE
jgi:predicted glycosyltransferase